MLLIVLLLLLLLPFSQQSVEQTGRRTQFVWLGVRRISRFYVVGFDTPKATDSHHDLTTTCCIRWSKIRDQPRRPFMRFDNFDTQNQQQWSSIDFFSRSLDQETSPLIVQTLWSCIWICRLESIRSGANQFSWLELLKHLFVAQTNSRIANHKRLVSQEQANSGNPCRTTTRARILGHIYIANC